MFKDKSFRDKFLSSDQYKKWNETLMELLKSVPTLLTNYELYEGDDEVESKIFDLKGELLLKSIQLGLYYRSMEDKELPEPQLSHKVSEDFEVDLQAFSKNVQELTLKTIDYHKTTDEDLIELIKDLQITGIENKSPQVVLKELKELRDSMK